MINIKLYKLIWERFIASQMATALLDTVSADIHAGDYLFKASGYSVKFDGFTVLYVEGKDGGGRGLRRPAAFWRPAWPSRSKPWSRQPALHPAAGPVH